MLVTITSSDLIQLLLVIVHVKVFAPDSKLETLVMFLVGEFIETVAEAIDHKPVPICGSSAIKVAVEAHTWKSAFTLGSEGESFLTSTSS